MVLVAAGLGGKDLEFIDPFGRRNCFGTNTVVAELGRSMSNCAGILPGANGSGFVASAITTW
jgi:hypothetical protein